MLVPRPVNPVGQIVNDEFTIVAQGNVADRSAEYCLKGQHITVEGRISTRTYDDENNQRPWVTEIQAYRLRPVDLQSSQASSAPFENNADIRVKESNSQSNFDFGAASTAEPLNEEVPF